jgi:hypothetical protein
VSSHENSKDIRSCCTPLIVLAESGLTGHDLLCPCAVVPCGRGLLSSGGWWWSVVDSLACIAVAVQPSRAYPCRQAVSIHLPRSAAAPMDQPSQHARRPCLCSSRAKRPASRDSCSVQAGRTGRATPMPACAHASTRPEVNLDCVLAAARGCVPRRSPPPVSRHSSSTEPASSTHPSLPLVAAASFLLHYQ